VSVVFWVILAIAFASIGLLAVLAVSLVKHVKLLATSIKTFQDGVQPLLESIQSEAEGAQDRMSDLSVKGAEIRSPDHGRAEPGARLPD